ncbi:MAG: type I-E CRISPR-associated protein Cse1/CasA [Desulfovibrionaceae bacterium]
MSFNLLTEPWLPVRRKSGAVERIAPWMVAGGDDPPVALAAPRPDFQAVLHELLIGLLQTACPPADRAAWRAWLAKPPEPETLRRAFEPLEPFFELLGEPGGAPRFMQDLELREKGGVANPASALIITEPTGKTLGDGTDFFLRRGGVEGLCPACAAMALFTLQAYAPGGGQGHRTGLRGGGPMTTIVLGRDLWTTLWSNVLLAAPGQPAEPEADLPGRVFPWAAPTRTSEGGTVFLPEDAHPLHCFWAMPRRIALLPEEVAGPEPCSLCGQESATVIRRYVTKNFGCNYADTWTHPLTPYRDPGTGKPLFSVKGQAGITGYRHWMGLVYGNAEGHAQNTRPAACVSNYRKNAPAPEATLLAAGYNMDNMKAVQWCEGTFPVLRLPGGEGEEWLEFLRAEVESLVLATDAMRSNLVKALKEALLGKKSKAKANQGVLEEVSMEVWNRTVAAFYQCAAGIIDAIAAESGEENGTQAEPHNEEDAEAARLALKRGWFNLLASVADELFRKYALSGGFEPASAQGAYEAFNTMKRLNWGLLHKVLGLPKPEKGNAVSEKGGTTP